MIENTKCQLQVSKILSPQKNSIVFISIPVSQNIILSYYISNFVSKMCGNLFSRLCKNIGNITDFASWSIKPKIFTNKVCWILEERFLSLF